MNLPFDSTTHVHDKASLNKLKHKGLASTAFLKHLIHFASLW